MHKASKPFRFATVAGQALTERIIEIEALAAKQIAAGTTEHSVLVGAAALLTLACKDVKWLV